MTPYRIVVSKKYDKYIYSRPDSTDVTLAEIDSQHLIASIVTCSQPRESDLLSICKIEQPLALPGTIFLFYVLARYSLKNAPKTDNLEGFKAKHLGLIKSKVITLVYSHSEAANSWHPFIGPYMWTRQFGTANAVPLQLPCIITVFDKYLNIQN